MCLLCCCQPPAEAPWKTRCEQWAGKWTFRGEKELLKPLSPNECGGISFDFWVLLPIYFRSFLTFSRCVCVKIQIISNLKTSEQRWLRRRGEEILRIFYHPHTHGSEEMKNLFPLNWNLPNSSFSLVFDQTSRREEAGARVEFEWKILAWQINQRNLN